MLNLLLDYARREKLSAEPGFKVEPVRWLLSFMPNGTFLGAIRRGDERGSGDRFVVPRLDLNAEGRGRRHFLCDFLETVTLFGVESLSDDKAAKARRGHTTFVEQLEEAAAAVPELQPIAAALRDEKKLTAINNALADQDGRAKPTDNATFHVQGHSPAILIESDAWHAWYKEFRRNLLKPSMRQMLSFTSGEPVTPARIHGKITGLASVGGDPKGDKLVTTKQAAFLHYGLQKGENAAVGSEEEATIRETINHLLREKAVDYAGAKSVYWYSGRLPEAFAKAEPIGDVGLFGSGAGKPDPEAEHDEVTTKDALRFEDRARKVLDSIRTGEEPEAANARFHLLTLAANSGRVVVRDVAESDLASLLEALLMWRERLTVTRVSGRTDVVPARLESLLTSLLPPKPPGQQYGDWIKPVHRLRDKLFREAIGLGDGSVLRAGVTQLLPQWRAAIMNGEFNEAVASEKAKGGRARINARVALMKAFLLQEGHVMEPGLKVDHPNDAYHYGRLLAVLADLQRAALPDVKANVVQRYYPRASTSPADAIGPLIRLSNSHLDKINKGLANFLQARIAEIFAAVRDPDPPKTLDAVGQSLFAMGFYQQIAQMNFDRVENAAKKRAKNDSKVENPEAGDENAQ